MTKLFFIVVVVLLSSSCRNSRGNIFTKNDLFLRVNKDSLVYNKAENYYIDLSKDSSGSLYRFSKKDNLVFYCFLNGSAYGYSEYFNDSGERIKVEGNPFIQIRTFKDNDSISTLSFLFSTFRKSNFKITTYTSFNDTLTNTLGKVNIYSNVGFFNIRFFSDSVKYDSKIINMVSYFDSSSNNLQYFSDTILIKEFIQ